MNDKQLETLKQLGDLGCYAAMDTRLCKLAYDEIIRLRSQYSNAAVEAEMECERKLDILRTQLANMRRALTVAEKS